MLDNGLSLGPSVEDLKPSPSLPSPLERATGRQEREKEQMGNYRELAVCFSLWPQFL